MPSYIAKFTDKDKKDYYLEWSTVVDAPVTYGMSLQEFKEYYRSEYGNSSMPKLEERLARVEEKGTSSFLDNSVFELIAGNRAGKNERSLKYAQIVKHYCVNKKEPK